MTFWAFTTEAVSRQPCATIVTDEAVYVVRLTLHEAHPVPWLVHPQRVQAAAQLGILLNRRALIRAQLEALVQGGCRAQALGESFPGSECIPMARIERVVLSRVRFRGQTRLTVLGPASTTTTLLAEQDLRRSDVRRSSQVLAGLLGARLRGGTTSGVGAIA